MDSSFVSCRSSPISKVGLYSAVFFFPVVAFALLFISFYISSELHTAYNHTLLQVLILLLMMTVSIVFALLLFVLSRKCYLMETRKISVNSNGFSIGKRKTMCYSWDEIENISIIIYAANASNEIYQTQICIFMEPLNDNALKRLRNSYLYGVFHQNNYILIDYKGIAADHLLKCSGIHIDDQRSRQMKL